MFAPFGSHPSNHSVWKPEPTHRGTYSVLSTCLVTMGLCVWTVVHLNLPEHGKLSSQRWRRLGWLLVGLLAPELLPVSTPSLHRFVPLDFLSSLMSSRLRHVAYDLNFYNLGNSPYHGKQPWTLVHGFYTRMGGFAMDTSDADQPFLPNSLRRVVLTPVGLRLIARMEPRLIPDISKEDIEDKGKANGLAKFIVCSQALWFCVVCITRIAEGLPISLLELNVSAHAICTLLIYLLWWDKPLDAQEPTLIK
ncbi:hypothetical protein BU16DRAFT_509670, partial [Lophium mytilinum]